MLRFVILKKVDSQNEEEVLAEDWFEITKAIEDRVDEKLAEQGKFLRRKHSREAVRFAISQTIPEVIQDFKEKTKAKL